MAKAKTPRTTTTRSKKNGGEAAVTPAVTSPENTSSSVPVAAAPEPARPAARPEAAAEVRPEPKELRKPAPEPRRNIVPINLEEEIRRRAYQLYEERGCTPGHENDDWLVAEREIMTRYSTQRQHSA